LPRRARYSSVIPLSLLGYFSDTHVEEESGEYLLIEACRLSFSWGGTYMPGMMRMRCMGEGAGEGACTGEGGGEGTSKGCREHASEGGTVGVCGATGRTTIEGMSLRNS
jgi:hypothetical protein